MEPLAEDPLHVAATRPALLWGLPLPLALTLGLGGAEIQVAVHGLKGVAWAVAIVAPLWVASRILVARDYNAVRVAFLWLDTSARAFDAADWGGASVAPLPVREARRTRRGMARG
ncbi:type IV secretion system protein VirB3 [Roseomonas sp. NAR14]|uniref:Type IV secretion system protein VirB3 n=1 Tax=Roseomonas acroporae TaxID=2937791 RepID=A0A9X2BY38_9PROT|nr:type IV secretion system protein VirB3 [Roseomonas acroporae]